ncbi:MAG: hypothetical protein HKO48_05340 [Nitrosopumilus sp.]|nr:hypothetical protein [Nitrosopumilus sp.]
MIFQKTNLKFLILILFGGLFLALVITFTNNPCNLESLMINNEIYSYEQTLDPEHCENILEKIDLYNDQCKSQLEILDCG